MKTINGTLIFGLMMTGCSGKSADAVTEQARQAVSYQLINPASAQFRELKVYPTSGEPKVSVCGQVNGQNRMGGYSGFQNFYYLVQSKEAHLAPEIPTTYADGELPPAGMTLFAMDQSSHCVGIDIFGSLEKSLKANEDARSKAGI